VVGQRIDECTFAVIDVETTGIDASCHRVIEVAVLTCDWTGAVLDRFESLVRPDDLAPVGQRAEMLAGAPTFAEVAGDVLAPLSRAVVTGHNVRFDLHFLDAELSRFGLRLPDHRYVCTRELATLLGCDVANRTLASLCAYLGVGFDRWHTAADDTTATAAVLAHLLGRAVGFGRVLLSSIESHWPGWVHDWPVLPAGGRALVRDVERWPPKGDQPGSKRAKEASFRRLGAGPASPSGAVVIDEAGGVHEAGDPSEAGDVSPDVVSEAGVRNEAGAEDPPAQSASELWWQGDFRGAGGITQLQETILPSFRATDDAELIAALLALADLWRRHGGRDAEVRAAFEEAYAVAERRHAWAPLDAVAEQWSRYLGALRASAAQVELLLRCLETSRLGTPEGETHHLNTASGANTTGEVADRAMDRVKAQVASSRRDEPVVAEQMARGAMAALSARGENGRAFAMLALLVETLDLAGRHDDAEALLEEAWAGGCTDLAVLDRLSRRLEQAGAHERAVQVCAQALGGATDAKRATTTRRATSPSEADTGQSALRDSLRHRHRRCQQLLAQDATLFG
jgi:DNA polymerase III epsilon subunit-like protein